MTNKPYTIGIDCGEKTGVGIYSRAADALIEIHTTDFFEVENVLSVYKAVANIFVEVPSKFLYARNAGQRGAVRDKHAINVGGNIREAELLAEKLRRAGYSVEEVPPIQQTKWTAEQFQRYLKTDLRSNQHERDAARIAWSYASKRVG